MKKILLFSVAILTSLFLMTQNCQPVMVGTPWVVYEADATHANSGDLIWICSGLTVEISGTGNTVFIEKNCTITLSGDGNNALYQKGTGSLTITGDNNNSVKYEAAVTFVDNGTGTTTTVCDTLKYDYKDAPVSPKKFCDVYAGVNEVKANESLRLYPNPATGVLNYEIPGNVIASSVEIFSTSGQKVYASSIDKKDGKIDISGLKNGLYLIIMSTDKGLYSGRVNVE